MKEMNKRRMLVRTAAAATATVVGAVLVFTATSGPAAATQDEAGKGGHVGKLWN